MRKCSCIFLLMPHMERRRAVCRVTPRGRKPVEAATATAAWAALYTGSGGSGMYRSGGGGLHGARAFGVAHPAVAALLRGLPGAERCERFCGWPDGQERPPPPPCVSPAAHACPCTLLSQSTHRLTISFHQVAAAPDRLNLRQMCMRSGVKSQILVCYP